MKLDLG